MAGIDKTYVNTWEDYKQIRDWAEKTNFVYTSGEVGEKLINWFYFPNLTESDFNGKEVPIWNTSYAEDYFLYKNCPLKIIQDRLKEQYKSPLIIKNIERPDKIHFKGIKRKLNLVCLNINYDNCPMYYRNGTWDINGIGEIYIYYYKLSNRKLKRLLNKWKLPVGSVVELFSIYTGTTIIKIKK